MNNPSRFPFKRPVQVQSVDIAGRTPPNNIELEAAVVAAELTNAECIDDVLTILPTPEPFYSDAHRRIHAAIIELHKANTPVDFGTVANVLQRQDRLHAVGGLAYLTKIVDATPYIANVATYAGQVRQLWRVRRTIAAGQQIAASGYEDYGDAETYLAGSVEKVANVADDKINQRDCSLLYDVVRAQIAGYGTANSRGVQTGLTEIDAKTTGLHDGELIIVAARPGMGKTSYAMNVAVNVASCVPAPNNDEPRRGVMVFSLEMPKEQLVNRMLCSESRVKFDGWRKQSLSGVEYDRLVERADELGQLPVWIDDTPAISLIELRAKVRRQQHAYDKKNPSREGAVDPGWKQRVGLIVVDYLQLMRGSPNAASREQEIAEISRGLKALSKELHVPVMALSQLNRAVETRSATKEKRPQLSDLRESGAIEQDADMVQFIYRPEYYIADKSSAEAKQKKGYAEIIIAKQRNGPTGGVAVTFIDDYVRFENRSRDAWREEGDD